MADAAAPKPAVDLQGIAAGVDLKKSEAPADKGLAQAAVLSAIKGQGVIAVPAERAPEAGKEGLNRGLLLNEIGHQGVISAQPGEEKMSPALAQGLILNQIAKGGIISVPEGSAPDKSMTKEHLAELQEEAASEKKEISEALDVHKAAMAAIAVPDAASAALKHVEPKVANDTLMKGQLLNAVKAKGGAAVDPSKLPKEDKALVQASVLGAIKSGGVISVPEGSAPDRALTDEQKSALLEDAQAEKKEDADNLEAHKGAAAAVLAGVADGAAVLKHQEAPVVDNSATLAHAGLLNELAKNT